MQTTASAEQHKQSQPREPATEASSTSSGFSIKQYSHGNGFFDKHKHTIYKKALEEMKLEAKESNAIGGSADDSVSDEEMFKRLSKKKRRRLMKRAENHVRKAVGEPKRKRVKATMRANKMRARKEEAVDVASCQYVQKNGKRCVVPYVHQFVTFTKKRWFNRGIYEVYTSEFNAHPPLYYRSSILAGFITLNGKKCTDLDVKLKNGDKIVHRTHRHEPPVLGGPIEVAHVDENYVIVSKPSTIPVHPCGAYYHNTLIHILRKERPELWPLNVVHRIDRLTSGLVLLARTSQAARKISMEIEKKTVSKCYLARVAGAFPRTYEEALLAFSEHSLAKLGGTLSKVFVDADHAGVSCKRFTLSLPQRCLDPKNGVYENHPDGKVAVTTFQFLDLMESPLAGKNYLRTSIVLCKPHTGRTHQIRLHLKALGFPIANDPNYGPSAEDGGKLPPPEKWKELFTVDICQPAETEELNKAEDSVNDDEEMKKLKSLCSYCNEGAMVTFTAEQLGHKGIWLHAMKYTGSDWSFRVSGPSWSSVKVLPGE